MDIDKREELLKDLQFIKEAVRKNNNILKFVPISQGIRNVALFSGAIIIALSLILLWLSDKYGDFSSVPVTIQTTIYVIAGISSAALVWLKIRGVMSVLRKHRQDISFVSLFREIYTLTAWMVIIPHLIAIIALIIYFSVSGNAGMIVPVVSILVSLLMISITTILNLKEWLPSFAWLLLSGCFCLFIAGSVSAPILMILTFGIGMLILYVTIQASILREKRD